MAVRRQQLSDALAACERRVALQPRNWFALRDYRNVLHRLDDPQQLLVICNRMLALASDDHTTLLICMPQPAALVESGIR